jgi:hypothetical protein
VRQLTHGNKNTSSILLKKLGKPETKEARVSLAGSIASYARKNEIFSRPEPNTFGLLEVDGEKEEAPEGASVFD